MSHKLVSLYIGEGEYYARIDVDNVIKELEESHKKEVGQLLIDIVELKKERDWLAKDRAQAYNDLEKRAQLNIKQEAEIAELKAQKAQVEEDCAYWKARAKGEM